MPLKTKASLSTEMLAESPTFQVSQSLGLPYAVLILTLHNMSILSLALFTESFPFPPGGS